MLPLRGVLNMSEWWETVHATDTCTGVPLCAGALLGTPEVCADPGLWRMRLLKEAVPTLASVFSAEKLVWWLVGFPVFAMPLRLLAALRPPAPFTKGLHGSLVMHYFMGNTSVQTRGYGS